jgi:leader peptidase (prepilin peptidase)/N-methyltransferase
LSNISLVVYSLIGLLIGGLLNVLADYLPRREPPGPPVCASCSKPHRRSRWLAVTGYLLAGGRCAHCGSRIRLRHLFTELATALLFAFLWRRYGPSTRLFLETLYTAVFVLLFVIDLEHKLILHVTTLPAIVLATTGSFFLGREDYNWRVALVGGATGFLLVLGLYLFGFLFVRLMEKRRGQKIGEIAFGFGDVTLTTFIGLVVGFPNVIFSLLLGIVLGGIGGAVFWLIKAVIRRSYSLFTAIPYGPFLIAAGWVMMIWGQEFLTWYSSG